MKKHIHMLIIAAILQAAVYLYLDQIFLMPAAQFSQKIVTENKLAVDPRNISRDKKYYAKLQPDTVRFYNCDDKQVKEIQLQDGDSISCFTWVPDTHLALIGINKGASQGCNAVLKPVDLDSDTPRPELMISDLAEDSTIIDASFSVQADAIYVLVQDKMESSVYRSDSSNHLTRVLSGQSVLRITVAQSEDILIYDNTREGAVYARGQYGRMVRISPQEGQYALIGIDMEDNIYIGRLSSQGVISDVLKGNSNGNFTEFQTLAYPYPVVSVAVDFDGKLILT